MGKSGKIILAVTIAAVVLFAYVYISAQLSATLISVDVESAAQRQTVFESLSDALENGDLSAVQYSVMESSNPEDYAFVTYTVDLEGYNPLPAEWAVLALAPAQGDVVLVQGSPQTAAPFGKATVTATLLTRADNVDAQRKIWVEYYVMGRALNAAVRTPS